MADGGEEGRLGLVGVLGVALGVVGGGARQAFLVVGDLQAAGELFLLVGQRDVVVLPAVDVAHVGHEMADIGAAGDADELVERIDAGQQHEQQRRRRRQREGVEGRRMGRADRHRRRDGGEQHEAEQHALQLVVLGGQHVARDAPAGAGEERQGGEPPPPADHLVVARIGAREIAAQDVEAQGDGEMRHERRHQLHQVDLPPVDRRDHRPQHEREVARLPRAFEQAADQFGAHEGFLPGRVLDVEHGRRRGGQRIDRERHGAVPVGRKRSNILWVAVDCPYYCIKNMKKTL